MLFSKESLKSYADSKGIDDIEDEAFRILSQDLEYRLKEVCQEAAKFMVACHRTKLNVSDINHTLISRNVEPLFGYESKEMLVFKGLPSGAYFIHDEEINLNEYLERPLPKIPLRPYVQTHWLAIEGIQPAIQQNPIVINKPTTANDTLTNYQEDMSLKKQVKHRLTKELNMYFEKVLQIMETDSTVAAECLSNETGIQQLVPYFLHHFNTELRSKITDDETSKTIALMYFSLLKNKFLFIDPYLHEIVPSILTCIVGKSPSKELRLLGIDILKYIFNTFSYNYQSLGPRIINTLKKTYLDESKSEGSQCGALLALSSLSPEITKIHILSQPCTLNKREVRDLYNEILNKNGRE